MESNNSLDGDDEADDTQGYMDRVQNYSSTLRAINAVTNSLQTQNHILSSSRDKLNSLAEECLRSSNF